ncbi:Sensor histidine kinase RcsC [Pseudoalteromonas sp. CIP111854]|uniref:histidine kinase n=1 Tax=Pseudoalteromonas holothuriae TaxID=2963714 RepID=A0A9W4R2A9_9GAMM|nr:ATP-binding protein [Pseudoalteromonas sp. CIP111854]CAH9063699.1 Sensor histidine kinase RcsC [Pseudoalteromonas sp. CIP111854]
MVGSKKPTYRWIKRVPLSSCLIILIIIMVSVVWVYDRNIKKQAQNTVAKQLAELLVEQQEVFENEVKIYRNYINFLVDTPPIQGISRAQRNQGIDPKDGTKTELWKNRLAMIFSSMMYTYGEINQLRLLDGKSGDELVRTDRYGGLVAVQPHTKLQNKFHRDYFTQALKLTERRIYASQIDLNKEHGKIVYPLEPTLRIAMPAYNEHNELFAVLVANINAQVLLDKLKHVLPIGMQVNLLTPDGHFIYHPNEALRFSKDLNPQENWQSYYSEQPWLVKNVSIVSSESMDYLTQRAELFASSNSDTGRVIGVSLIPYAQYEEALQYKRLSAYSLIFIIAIIFTLGLLAFWAYFRNNQQLLEARSQLADIINGASDGIIGFNNELKITSHNHAAEQFFTELKDITNASYKRLNRYIPENYLHATLYNVSNRLPLEDLEIKVALENKDLDLHLTASPIHSVDGQLLGFAMFVTDITEQNKVRTEIVKINASLEAKVEQRTLELALAKGRAEESSKVKSAFISSISHEMRTPLNGILGTLDLVRREALSQQQSNYLDMMSTSAKTLLSLINDVLDLSKIEAGKLEMDRQPFNPIQMLEHVASSVGIKAQQKHLEYLLDVTDVRYLTLEGDAGRLKQVLYNLISNAIKFTSYGGVFIYAKTKEDDKQVWLEVSVKDTGVGIAKNNFNRLFEAFSQETQSVSNEYGGTGLGLSICKQLCELMGGNIQFQSEKDKGSTFSFNIPYARRNSKKLNLIPILDGKKIFLAAKTKPEETYWKKIIELFGASICDLDHADFWLIDFGSELGQNLSTGPSIGKKACFIYDPITDPTPPKCALATISKPVRYIDVLAAFNKADTLTLFGLANTHGESKNFASRFSLLKGHTVIIVDDNQINLEVAKGVLSAHHITSILVHSGHELLEKLKGYALEQLEVLAILMDCNMPVMTGYEATAAVRSGEGGEFYKSVPIIALTASAMHGEAERCKSVGMNDYVTKPIDAERLFSTLSNYVDKAASVKASQSIQLSNSPDRDNKYQAPVDIPSLDSTAALARLMHDKDLYTKICQLFKESANARLTELTDAIEQVDEQGVKQAAHALKGQAGDVGAKRLHHLTNQLEISAQDKEQSETHRALYVDIKIELEQVCAQIDLEVINTAR